MKFKGVVTDTRMGVEGSVVGEGIAPITAIVEVSFHDRTGSVVFSCQAADAPKIGDTYIVEVTRLDLPPQSWG